MKCECCYKKRMLKITKELNYRVKNEYWALVEDDVLELLNLTWRVRGK